MSLACGLFSFLVLSVSDVGPMMMVPWGQWEGSGKVQSLPTLFSTHNIFLQQNFNLIKNKVFLFKQQVWMVTWVFSKTIKRRNRQTWLSWLMGQAIYLASGLEIKEARLLNWDPYEATRKDKLAQVPLSPQPPDNTLAVVKTFF